jgi:hypothetical protein
MLKTVTIIANVPDDFTLDDIQDVFDDLFLLTNKSKDDFYVETVESVED